MKSSYFAEKWQAKVKQRVGITRHNHALVIQGIPIQRFLKSPEIVRERWCHQRGGRFYHFAIMRYTLLTQDGRTMVALQSQCHDAHKGFPLSLTGFYSVQFINVE